MKNLLLVCYSTAIRQFGGRFTVVGDPEESGKFWCGNGSSDKNCKEEDSKTAQC